MEFAKLLINFYFCPDVLYDQPLGSSVIYYKKNYQENIFSFSIQTIITLRKKFLHDDGYGFPTFSTYLEERIKTLLTSDDKKFLQLHEKKIKK